MGLRGIEGSMASQEIRIMVESTNVQLLSADWVIDKAVCMAVADNVTAHWKRHWDSLHATLELLPKVQLNECN